MDLLFDIGNSRIKWACCESRSWVQRGTLADAAALDGLAVPAVERIAVAATGRSQLVDLLRERCARRWPDAPMLIAATGRRFGRLVNAYAEPGNLGVDRWLAMVAAWSRLQAAFCVIDIGTAITVDLVGHDGRHHGGWICPGTDLMRESLAAGTARVRAAATQTDQVWGRDTPDAVVAGTREATVGLLERAAALARRSIPDVAFVITGGGADRAAAHFAAADISCTVDAELVLDGLRLWLQERGR